MDEEVLVRRIARGDRAAFDALCRRTSRWLAARLRRRCADDDLVAEVMQETCLATGELRRRSRARVPGATAVGWVWTIAATHRSPARTCRGSGPRCSWTFAYAVLGSRR